MNPAHRHVLPALLLALSAGALARCGGGVTPRTDAGVQPIVDPTLELGTGQSSWEGLADGASVELIHGPQGGYHLFARIRERGLGADVQVTFRVTPEGGGDPINDPDDRIRLIEGRGLIRSGQGWESASALLVILSRVRGPTEVVGRRFVIEARVAPTGSGAAASVRRTVTVVDET